MAPILSLRLCGVGHSSDGKKLSHVLQDLQTQVMPILFALFIMLFFNDEAHNRLGSSNGKFISFVDTCMSLCEYRAGSPLTPQKKPGLLQTIRITASCFVVKFAAGSVVSHMLGMSPVWLSGPRHALWLIAGVALIWFVPEDIVYRSMRHSSAVKLMLGIGGGLYKMRKAIFAVEAATRACRNVQECSFALAFVVTILAVDGNTLVRRGVLWAEAGLANWQRLRADVYYATGRILGDSGVGAQRLLLRTLLPLSVVTIGIWSGARSEWVNGITDDSFLGLRVSLLGGFIWRTGCFHELASIHVDSLKTALTADNVYGRTDQCTALAKQLKTE